MSLASGIYSLAPRWMGVFEKWDILKRFQKEAIYDDLKMFNKNPVGEAHSWKLEYYDREHPNYCPECSWFGWSYNYVITGDMNLDKEILELKGKQFCDHWTTMHNGHGSSSKSPPGRNKTKDHSH